MEGVCGDVVWRLLKHDGSAASEGMVPWIDVSGLTDTQRFCRVTALLTYGNRGWMSMCNSWLWVVAVYSGRACARPFVRCCGCVPFIH